MTVTPSIVEIGNTITSVVITYSCTITPSSLTLNGNAITPTQTGEITLNNLSLTDDDSWTLVAQTASGTTATKEVELLFANNIYYGVASEPTTVNEAFIKQQLTKELKETKNKRFTVNASTNQYIWFAVPVRYRECSFSVGGFSGGFELATTIANFEHLSGYEEAYRVYKSDNPNLGNTTVEVM